MEQVKAITTEQEAETAVQYIVVRIGNEQYGINIKYIDNQEPKDYPRAKDTDIL